MVFCEIKGSNIIGSSGIEHTINQIQVEAEMKTLMNKDWVVYEKPLSAGAALKFTVFLPYNLLLFYS
jgi:hypothetical protein